MGVRVWIRYGAQAVRSKAWAVALLAAGAAQAEDVTVIAFGDSLTQGYGLFEDDGLVPQLQAWLDAQGADATVVNAGVSGDTTAGGLARVAWTITPEADAIIVALGGNDVLRGLDPAEARKNLDGIVKTATEAGLAVMVVGTPVPGNYGPAYQAAFEAIYPDIARTYGAVHVESFFGTLLPEGATPADAAAFMQPDGIHPNAEGVKRIVDGVGPAVLDLIGRVDAGS